MVAVLDWVAAATDCLSGLQACRILLTHVQRHVCWRRPRPLPQTRWKSPNPIIKDVDCPSTPTQERWTKEGVSVGQEATDVRRMSDEQRPCKKSKSWEGDPVYLHAEEEARPDSGNAEVSNPIEGNVYPMHSGACVRSASAGHSH